MNDLAVSGATPLYLTLNAFIEEGFEIASLERIIASLAQAAREANVVVVAGDTKVARRGEGGGIYLATTGIGLRPPSLKLGLDKVRAGDAILVSGPVGDHGIAVLLAREQFWLSGSLHLGCGECIPIGSDPGGNGRTALYARPHTRRHSHSDARDMPRH